MPYEIVKRERGNIVSVTKLPERVNYTVRDTMPGFRGDIYVVRKIVERGSYIFITLVDPYDSLNVKEISFR